MTELYRHIGPDTDVPAGDIGVGAREIGFLFGQYKKLSNEFTGVLTGKGLNWGGTLIRPEATGYGCVYFAEEMLATRKEASRARSPGVRLRQRRAVHRREADPAGRQAVTLSDSSGTSTTRTASPRETGLGDGPEERASRTHQGIRREVPSAVYTPIDPAAEQPALGPQGRLRLPLRHAKRNQRRGRAEPDEERRHLVSEGANMPTTPEGVDIFLERKILYGPGKAANAGGVAVSGLEMTPEQHAASWTREEVDKRLQMIMKSIHKAAMDAAAEYGHPGNYVVGANIAGFLKVVDAMMDQGVV